MDHHHGFLISRGREFLPREWNFKVHWIFSLFFPRWYILLTIVLDLIVKFFLRENGEMFLLSGFVFGPNKDVDICAWLYHLLIGGSGMCFLMPVLLNV